MIGSDKSQRFTSVEDVCIYTSDFEQDVRKRAAEARACAIQNQKHLIRLWPEVYRASNKSGLHRVELGRRFINLSPILFDSQDDCRSDATTIRIGCKQSWRYAADMRRAGEAIAIGIGGCHIGCTQRRINWQTGASSEHWINRRIGSYQEHADIERLRTRVGELKDEAKTDVEIAAMLTAEGYRAARGEEINSAAVFHMRNLWGIRAHWRYEEGRNPQQWDDGTYSIQGAAAAIGVTVLTVHSWLRRGLLEGRQAAKGAPWKITLTEEQIASLREYADQARPGRRQQSG